MPRALRNTFASRRFNAVLYDRDPAQGLPIVLAAACRTRPVALLLSVPSRDTPDEVFKRVPVTMRAYVRQGDRSLFFDWYDEPPQEVRALPQNILRNALSVLIFLLYLVVAPAHTMGFDISQLSLSSSGYLSVTDNEKTCVSLCLLPRRIPGTSFTYDQPVSPIFSAP